MNRVLEASGTVAWPCASSAASAASIQPFSALLFAPHDSAYASASQLLGGTNAAAAFFREVLPWSSIARWTHQLPKTPTDRWMDLVDGAVRGPNHRWMNHHVLDFLPRWLSQSPNDGLRWSHFLRHLALDSITIKGIPLLPSTVHQTLVSLGIPATFLYNWTHVNLFDIAIGAVSVITGSRELFLALRGALPWQGPQTLLLTFGVGGAEIAGGALSHNPFLVVGGAAKIAAGTVSYWQHLHVPAQAIPAQALAGALMSLLAGAGAGTVVAAFRLALAWSSTTAAEKVAISAESIGISSGLALLSLVSPWTSIPLGLAYGAGKAVFRMAQRENTFWNRMPVSSSVTEVLCYETLRKLGGEQAVECFEQFLAHRPSLCLDSAAREFLADGQGWPGGTGQ